MRLAALEDDVGASSCLKYAIRSTHETSDTRPDKYETNYPFKIADQRDK
jgi:hypothetical protein